MSHSFMSLMLLCITYHHHLIPHTHMHTRKDKKLLIITTKSPLSPPHFLSQFKTAREEAPLSLFILLLQDMRVPPVKSPQNNNNPKPTVNLTPNINFRTHNNTPNSCYEPTSVLDLRRSPSPVPEKPVEISDPPVEWDEQILRNMDWDSIMSDLGLDDDVILPFKSNTNQQQQQQHHHPQSQIQHHFAEFTSSQAQQQLDSQSDFNFTQILPDHQNFVDVSNNNFQNLNLGFDFIEELIRAADCFDSNELQLAQMILARLNQRLRSPIGKPLQRAAFFFKEALNSLLTGSSTRSTIRLSSWSEIVQSIRAYKAFSGISPIPMFTHFTSNQALLESLDGSSRQLIHIIDFDIGFGGQYASFMREIAESNPASIRITAIVPEEYAIETRLIKENLIHFAEELKIRFQIDFVLIRTFEMLSFKAVKFMDGEKTAVVLSPIIFRRMGLTNNVVGFVTDLRRLSPAVVVFVDGEGWTESGATTSFRRSFVNSLEYYSMMFESLDAAGAGGVDWARKIEMFLLRPRILAVVEAAAGGRRVASWRDLFVGAGMRPVLLSQFADFQAECLLGKVQVGGFHVAKRQAELVLCWHERALVATSAWRF